MTKTITISLEAGSLKSRCQQGRAPSRHSGKESFLASSNFLWLCPAPISVSVFTWPYLCGSVSKFPSYYKDISHWIRAHCNPS
uniref:Uncharacterized protein n=1 Tax=Rhinolophus ferrumequinum TaxID=59479 RepID=A0A671EUT3_RHIFE